MPLSLLLKCVLSLCQDLKGSPRLSDKWGWVPANLASEVKGLQMTWKNSFNHEENHLQVDFKWLAALRENKDRATREEASKKPKMQLNGIGCVQHKKSITDINSEHFFSKHIGKDQCSQDGWITTELLSRSNGGHVRCRLKTAFQEKNVTSMWITVWKCCSLRPLRRLRDWPPCHPRFNYGCECWIGSGPFDMMTTQSAKSKKKKGYGAA